MQGFFVDLRHIDASDSARPGAKSGQPEIRSTAACRRPDSLRSPHGSLRPRFLRKRLDKFESVDSPSTRRPPVSSFQAGSLTGAAPPVLLPCLFGARSGGFESVSHLVPLKKAPCVTFLTECRRPDSLRSPHGSLRPRFLRKRLDKFESASRLFPLKKAPYGDLFLLSECRRPDSNRYGSIAPGGF